MIKDELSVFTSIGPAPLNVSSSKEGIGAKPLQITGFEKPADNQNNFHSADSHQETSSIDSNLEDMLEGSNSIDKFPSGSQASQEFKGNFLLGLGLALAVVGLGFAAAFLLDLI